MDEIDAALDYKNIGIIAQYIKKKATGAQFMVISLKQNMFQHSWKMVGIYKVNHVTMTSAVCPEQIQQFIN